MLTVAFANRLKSNGITVNACHPGDVNSKLSNAFGFGGSESPEEGAATPLYLSLSKELTGITGKYYEHLRPVSCQFADNLKAIDHLYALCNQRDG
jgi:retinol dehydrogenase-13